MVPSALKKFFLVAGIWNSFRQPLRRTLQLIVFNSSFFILS